jgi:hypothetical protein
LVWCKFIVCVSICGSSASYAYGSGGRLNPVVAVCSAGAANIGEPFNPTPAASATALLLPSIPRKRRRLIDVLVMMELSSLFQIIVVETMDDRE